MTTCPSSSRKSPPSCSEDPYKSWPASRLKLGQRVETSSSSSSERGSRTSTSERSFTSRSSDIVILSAKQYARQQGFVVLLGGFHDALPRRSSGAEGGYEGVVLTTHNEYVGVRLVQVVRVGKARHLLPSFVPFLCPIRQNEYRPLLADVVAGFATGSARPLGIQILPHWPLWAC